MLHSGRFRQKNPETSPGLDITKLSDFNERLARFDLTGHFLKFVEAGAR